MEGKLTRQSSPEELVRAKKSLQFIKEVIRSYELGLCDHVGFSCALAISKAEDLKSQLSPFSSVSKAFDQLIEALKSLYHGLQSTAQAEEALEAIVDYFSLDKYALTRR